MRSGVGFFVFFSLLIAPVVLGVLFLSPPAAIAAEPTKLVITSAPQTIEPNASSSVIALQLQNDLGEIATSTQTLHVNFISSSLTGQFVSASITTNTCGSGSSVYFSKGTSNKGLCYLDSTPGTYELAFGLDELPAVPPAVQTIFITASSSGATTTPTSTPAVIPTTTPESSGYNYNIKIFRFLPNPSGDDAGNEWVEIKNQDTNEVALDGWYLDDKNTGEGPATDSLVLSGTIASGEIKRIILPSTAFALNNSGGDEINIYFDDKSLAETAVYTETAYDDGVFEFRDGAWRQPARETSGSSGGGSVSAVEPPRENPTKFLLNEIFPNPQGDDPGKEWIEIFNPSAATSSLAGYFLADGDSDAFTSSAWAIPAGIIAPPLGLVVIELPKDAFLLNNTGREKVKIFSPQKQLLDSTVYETAPENRSWAKNVAGKWEWSIPTFGKNNDAVPELPKIYISEILPQPEEDEEEFVELRNAADRAADLSGVVLRIGSRSKTFEAGSVIEPGGFLTIYEDDLPVRLRNSGNIIKLFDVFGRLITEVTYPKSKTGLAFASVDGKNYLWTSNATPDAANEMVLGAAVVGSSQVEPDATAADSKSAPALTRAQARTIISQNNSLQAQLAAVESALTQLQSQTAPAAAADPGPKPDNSSSLPWLGYFGLVVLAAGASSGISWAFLKNVAKKSE
ncbi:MAG: lamin tail domain-containing protein [Patescibacteria group bacterium]|nr:lamin tail domain-containing protein [Patescibacteria group bacterium]